MQKIHILFALSLLAAVVAACVSTAGATPSSTYTCPSTEPFVTYALTTPTPSTVVLTGRLVDCAGAALPGPAIVDVEIRDPVGTLADPGRLHVLTVTTGTDLNPNALAGQANQPTLFSGDSATLQTDPSGGFAVTITNMNPVGSGPRNIQTFVRLGQQAGFTDGHCPASPSKADPQCVP